MERRRSREEKGTHWCALSRGRLSFERILAVKLDRIRLAAKCSFNREVNQVGVVHVVRVGDARPTDGDGATAVVRPSRTLVFPAAFSRRTMAVLQELVVVQFVATGASVALVLRHRVGDRLVHVDVHLGTQHGHVVAWGEEKGGVR